MATGQWNIGPINLPDFGITEALGIGQANPFVTGNYLSANAPAGFSPSQGQQQQILKQQPVTAPVYGPAKPTNLNTNTTTNNPTTPPASNNPSAPSVEDLARQSYFSYLDSQMNNLPGLQNDLTSQINSAYGGQQSSINTGLQTTLNNLGQSQSQIDQNKAKSLRELDQSMANQLKAGNVYLGTRGAGDSSAANQYAYALSKVGTQARSGVQQQANQLYAQVQTQMNNAKAVAQDQLNQLDTWKNTQLAQVSQYISSLRGNIDSARANYIQSWLGNIDNQVNTYKQAVASWITNNAQSVGQAVQQLQQYGIGPNPSISSPNLPASNWTNPQDYSNYLFGYSNQKKDQNSGY